jgi:hypothetical protein
VDLGHLSGHDDNATKAWCRSSEENRNNTLIALLCVKPLAWLELSMSTKHERPLLTNRRSFLRVVGGVGLTSVVAPGYLMANLSNTASGILVEAAGFDDLVGWMLDTQHYQQMGGNRQRGSCRRIPCRTRHS